MEEGGEGVRRGKLDHYLQVKPVADALRYTEQKRTQTTQIDGTVVDIMKGATLLRGI